MEKLYILAISNGPILKTILQAKTTRELWGASYLLSVITEKEMDLVIPGGKFLAPAKVSGNRLGAACYPERAYWQLSTFLSEEQLSTLKHTLWDQLAGELSCTGCKAALQKYLRTNFVQVEVDPSRWPSASFLTPVNTLLDTMDFMEKWNELSDFKIIDQIIAKKSGLKGRERPIYKWRSDSNQGFAHTGDFAGGLGRFPNMLEIATSPLPKNAQHRQWYKESVIDATNKYMADLIEYEDGKTDIEPIEKDLITKIKGEFKNDFLECHNYVCIVYADGDGIGQYLKENVAHDPDRFKQFSEKLRDFSLQATLSIIDYGGLPVFSGGDDLLFYAPVYSAAKDGCSFKFIFDLLLHLNDMIGHQLPGLSMSFGVAIGHYKQPMDQGLKIARDQLFEQAKKISGKNSISVHLEKHSGSGFKFNISLKKRAEDSSIERMIDLLKLMLDKNVFHAERAIDAKFLKSVMYKLQLHEKLLSIVFNKFGLEQEINSRLRNFFNNNFNEEVHKPFRENYEAFNGEELFGLIRRMLCAIIPRNDKDQFTNKLSELYSVLKFCEFLIAEDHGD